MFVWTVDGVIGVVFLLLLLIAGIIFGGCLLIDKFNRWREGR